MRFVNAQVVEVENMLSGRKVSAHSTRVKFYSNQSLHKVEELQELLEYQAETLYNVEEVLELKLDNGIIWVHVSWLGFAGENTWQKLSTLYEDIPVMVHEYLQAHASEPLARQAASALGLKLC